MFGDIASKRAAERVVAESGVPWTTLRATQFHDLAWTTVSGMAKLPVIPVPSGFRWQPVDTDEVATRLAELAHDKPAGLVDDIAGPRVYAMDELLRGYLEAVGKHRVLLPLKLPGQAARVPRWREPLPGSRRRRAHVGAVSGRPPQLTNLARAPRVPLGTPTTRGTMLSFKRAGALAAGLFILSAAPASAAEIPVFNTSSSGAGSLRAALNTADDLAGHDTIVFDIPVGNLQPIVLNTALPEVHSDVTIDGYSQEGAVAAVGTTAADPAIVIDASNVAQGLNIEGSNVEVRGLVIRNATGDGIVLAGSDNVIAGNHIGVNSAGTVVQANADYGVEITGGTNNLIGGPAPEDRNVISGNTLGNVRVEEGNGQRIEGNYLGTNALATAGLGGGDGVLLDTDDNVVIDNVVSFNLTGVNVKGDDNTVEDNRIGTNLSGTVDLGNLGGVNVTGDGNEIVDNVVSGNVFDGITVRDPATANEVRDNLIGTSALGTTAIPNFGGVSLLDSPDNTVEGNVISGNQADGVRIAGEASDSNVVEDNWIGTDASETRVLGNLQSGVEVVAGDQNRIGKKLRRSVSNVIAHNGLDGVTVTSGIGNAIVANSIHDNGELGIDLGNDGTTGNDGPEDDDSGANTLQNGPDIDAVTDSSVTWEFESEKDTDYRLEFFASDECDPSGSGEGQDYLGFVDVTTDANGEADDTMALEVGDGRQITMTATRLTANATLRSTSEFSPCES